MNKRYLENQTLWIILKGTVMFYVRLQMSVSFVD